MKIIQYFKRDMALKISNVDIFNQFHSRLCYRPKIIRWLALLMFYIICLPFISGLEKHTKEKLQNFSLSGKPFEFLCHGQKIKFYLPNLLYDDGTSDLIQKYIFMSSNFYECYMLRRIKRKYIKKDSIILDIGSNIGNHVIYWGKICNAKLIYCFEPIKSTFNILQDNITLNNLEANTVCFNCAVGGEKGFAQINNFSKNNIGGTSIKESENGDINMIAVDSIESIHHVDFIKIDVEGFEHSVLQGCKEILNRYKPIVVIEIFPDNFSQVNSFFTSISYDLIESLGGSNFVYRSKSPFAE